MAVLASSIISKAQIIAQDTTGVRWPFAELLGWLNDAQRELAIYKPSATATNAVLQLKQGTLQDIGDGGLQLLSITRNLKSGATDIREGGRAIRKVERLVLDAQHPQWHDSTVFAYTTEVKHFCFDPIDPTRFYVFPGNTGAGYVEAIISRAPADLAVTGDANLLGSYATPIGVPDVYSNALLDYVLYRAYAKDADYAGNADRSTQHYQAFMASVSTKAQNEQSGVSG
ncbi:DUF6682 family protein [Pseudomonas luteola]|uniref:phage adaptor protein n=1 Tax=Pseudomonas luteola TaxID=47886 RepID=UPI003A83A750